MRLLWILLTLTAGGYGIWWVSDTQPFVKEKIDGLMHLSSIRALEVRYQLEQVIEAHQKRLLKEKGTRVVESSLKFYPHLLIEAKYTSKKKTKESLLLWDLNDGEMILDTKNWEKTHGFGDCMQSHVMPHEFRIMHILSRKGGSCERKHLLEKLEVDFPVLEAWMRSCHKKNLIVETGDKYRLHLQNPKLTRVPETVIGLPLVTRTYKQAVRMPKHFSMGQIQKMARTAFGPQFSVRKATEVYLPVYCIVVQTPDGAMQTTHINALTGSAFSKAMLYE